MPCVFSAPTLCPAKEYLERQASFHSLDSVTSLEIRLNEELLLDMDAEIQKAEVRREGGRASPDCILYRRPLPPHSLSAILHLSLGQR